MKNNRILSPLDERDFTAECVGLSSESIIPEEYISEKKAKTLIQMFSGQCVAHSVTTTMAYCELKVGLKPNDYSRGFLYMMEKKNRDDGPGSYTREVLSVAQKYGNLPWSKYKFGNNDCYSLWNGFSKKRDKLCSFASCKILNYFRLKTKEEIQRCVLKNGACVFDYPIYKGNGGLPKRYKIPKKDAKISGWHSVTCIGWTKDSWILQDSYGVLRSRFEIPFDYCPVETLECWGITIDKTNERYNVNKVSCFLSCFVYFPIYIKNQFVDWFHEIFKNKMK
jgi:hypothetical protein